MVTIIMKNADKDNILYIIYYGYKVSFALFTLFHYKLDFQESLFVSLIAFVEQS